MKMVVCAGRGGRGGYIELVVEHPVNMTKVRSRND